MLELMPYFRLCLYLSLPLLFGYVICHKCYQVRMRDILYWWLLNPFKSKQLMLILISSFFANLIFVLGVGMIVDMLYLSLYGEEQTLMFLGAINEKVDYYLPVLNANLPPLEAYRTGTFSRFSFDSLYLVEMFIHDKGYPDVGIPIDNINGKNAFLGIGLGLATVVPLMAIWHLIAVHALPTVKPDSWVNNMNLRESYSRLFSKIGLTNEKAVFFSILLIFVSAIPSVFSKRVYIQAERAIPLPIEINSQLQVQPISIQQITYTKKENGTGDRKYDTGKRNIVFRIDAPFDPAVYITYQYKLGEEPARLSEIKKAIKQNWTIDAYVTSYMTLGLDAEDDDEYK